jgi:hypothetical protein
MTPVEASQEVRLKRGVFLAVVEAEGILLDLPSNRYIALDASATAIWRHLAGDPEVDVPAADLIRQIEVWTRLGLIAPATEVNAALLPQAKALGASASVHLDPGAARVSTASALRLLRAGWWRRRSLARRGLSGTLYHLQREARPPRAAVPDQTVARAVRTLRAVRLPFRVGASDCLARSVDLVRALSQEGVAADLCFGVTRSPFRAHAWVEWDGRVLSEPTSQVLPYVLIARF